LPSTSGLTGNPRGPTTWLSLKPTSELDNEPPRNMTELAGNAVRPSRVQITELLASVNPASGTQPYITELPESTTLSHR